MSYRALLTEHERDVIKEAAEDPDKRDANAYNTRSKARTRLEKLLEDLQILHENCPQTDEELLAIHEYLNGIEDELREDELERLKEQFEEAGDFEELDV